MLVGFKFGSSSIRNVLGRFFTWVVKYIDFFFLIRKFPKADLYKNSEM